MLLTPEGNVAAFAPWLPEPPARVLDCACGIGLLAAGLARAGYEVAASDLSPDMVARTRALGEPPTSAAYLRAWNRSVVDARRALALLQDIRDRARLIPLPEDSIS